MEYMMYFSGRITEEFLSGRGTAFNSVNIPAAILFLGPVTAG